MDISERLKTIASLVSPCNVFADIGTDHGYLPVYLYKEGIIKKGIASDINPEPLKKAAENIEKYGCKKYVETRMGSGLSVLRAYEADCVAIAGMGGMLINEILSSDIKTAESVKELILSPQHDIKAVREFLHGSGFKIQDEKMIFEAGKYYTVIKALRGSEKYENEAEYAFGKILIKRKDKTLNGFVQKEKEKLENLLKALEKEKTDGARSRSKEIEQRLTLCMEVLECL